MSTQPPVRTIPGSRCGSVGGPGVMPAVRVGFSGSASGPGSPAARRVRHQPEQIPDPDTEHAKVDDRKRRERAGDRRRVERRHRIGSAQQSMDGIRLAPHFRRGPSGQDRDESRGPHREREAVQVPRVIQTPAQPGYERAHAERQDQDSDPDHHAERPEDDRDRRPVRTRHGVEARERRVGVVLQDQ